ncbi:MerR family transcriptional regulator [Massilia sp. 9096]|uniref:MerR family transcriptional regulator n=1 Tax=Massilia sp. 9096 TaxID=1500894 RepID=UPI00056D4AF3|nr:MerR family transcriptional regulator [Massilia sp. 9096]
MLKVGELAALAKLTVRTLHHYDSIGLLSPSARSDAGYRLYDRNDVARLQSIQALRSFGMSLADIGLCLDSPAGSPLAVVDRQLAELERQLHETARMRDQLLRLRGDLAAGATPDMSTWLTTLEEMMTHMQTYETYFTPDELEQLPMYHDDAAKADWQGLVEQGEGLMRSQVAPASDAAKAFALRWLQTFERDTRGDARLVAKINAMAMVEHDKVGVPKPLMDFVLAAVGELKAGTWARYLAADTLARMRRHSATRGHEWTGLMTDVQAAMERDPEARSPAASELARRWMDLFHDMVGTDPSTVAAFRRATASEPLLRMGAGLDDAMIGWLRRAMPGPKAA